VPDHAKIASSLPRGFRGFQKASKTSTFMHGAHEAHEEATMASYLQRFDATPVAQRWPLVRGWIFGEPLPFFAELRRDRPILAMPELTIATRYDDCTRGPAPPRSLQRRALQAQAG
jgi:hypothetical protein